jgi:hypothetical protein
MARRLSTVPAEWLAETTALSSAQSARLANDIPESSKVVAWDATRCGPVVLRADGVTHTLSPLGRLIPLRRAA